MRVQLVADASTKPRRLARPPRLLRRLALAFELRHQLGLPPHALRRRVRLLRRVGEREHAVRRDPPRREHEAARRRRLEQLALARPLSATRMRFARARCRRCCSGAPRPCGARAPLRLTPAFVQTARCCSGADVPPAPTRLGLERDAETTSPQFVQTVSWDSWVRVERCVCVPCREGRAPAALPATRKPGSTARG